MTAQTDLFDQTDAHAFGQRQTDIETIIAEQTARTKADGNIEGLEPSNSTYQFLVADSIGFEFDSFSDLDEAISYANLMCSMRDEPFYIYDTQSNSVEPVASAQVA